jgi:hypothetical protein
MYEQKAMVSKTCKPLERELRNNSQVKELLPIGEGSNVRRTPWDHIGYGIAGFVFGAVGFYFGCVGVYFGVVGFIVGCVGYYFGVVGV